VLIPYTLGYDFYVNNISYDFLVNAAWNRILDNLPLVVPIPRFDQENAVVYQHGFQVGLKGQYAGVSSCSVYSVLIIIIEC